MDKRGAGAASRALAQFSVCRQPWDSYIQAMGKPDDVPYEAEMNMKPMYRGRKRGFEEWYTKAGVQLHYRRYPDEQVFANLSRFRSGDLVGDVGFQQFRMAQPHLIGNQDEQGLKTVPPEDYMKLNYKNPATIGKYLTRGGHLYQHDILPLHPIAFAKLRYAKYRAIKLGLFPRLGNPFWFRSQEFRPKPRLGEYDPIKSSTKETMANYAFNWLRVHRVKNYFEGIDALNKEKFTAQTAESRMQGGYEVGDPDAFAYRTPGDVGDDRVPFSPKVSTVPGLMATTGLKKPLELYSRVSNKRFGFPNPLTKKKL